MQGGATSVEGYLADLPPDRRDLVAALRAIVLEKLPAGFVERINRGMISYEVPLEVSGKTYNGKPLMYVAIGLQKAHVSLYLCGLYCRAPLKQRFEAAYKAAGIKLDMGKACVRIKHSGQVEAGAIGSAVAAMRVTDFIEASHH